MNLIATLTLVVIIVYLLNSFLLSYWKRRGIVQIDPKFLFGDAGSLLTVKKSIGVFLDDFYKKYKDIPIIGVYMSYLPVLMVHDPQIVQAILVKDFSSFHDRPMPVEETKDPLSGHLFNIAGQKWRDLRVKLSPTFTSGKLKGMFPIIRSCGLVLDEYLVKNVKQGIDVFEFRDLLARYATNIISSVAFGIENDCINNPDHIFRRMGAKFFKTSAKNGIRNALQFTVPKLFHKLQMKTVDQDIEDFIFSIIKQNVEYREKTNFTRNDFMQLLIQLKNHGVVSADGAKNEQEDSKSETFRKLNLGELAAQAFVFFVAGFETTSSTMSFCLFELARNPDAQRKVQEEIDSVFKSTQTDEITYEMLEKLTYLECCINETLRKYPVVPFLFRECLKDYKVPDHDIVIPKGTSVFISPLGFHRDPEIFEDPMKFKPERFLNSPTGGGNSKGIFYMPFGDGPRMCIGMRMGKLTTKIGLSLVLAKFKVELAEENMQNIELEFHPSQPVLAPTKLFNLKVQSR